MGSARHTTNQTASACTRLIDTSAERVCRAAPSGAAPLNAPVQVIADALHDTLRRVARAQMQVGPFLASTRRARRSKSAWHCQRFGLTCPYGCDYRRQRVQRRDRVVRLPPRPAASARPTGAECAWGCTAILMAADMQALTAPQGACLWASSTNLAVLHRSALTS